MLSCTPTPPDRATLEAERKALVEELQRLTRELEAEGAYDCCIASPCRQCALRTGGCRCGEGARRGEPVCEECALMWRRGQGAEPGVDPASVHSFSAAEERLDAARACRCAEGEPADPPR